MSSNHQAVKSVYSKITEVAFGFSEAGFAPLSFEDKGEISALNQANAFLKRVTPPELGYYKTDFKVTFADGHVYEGRYDIGSDAASIEEHVVKFCTWVLSEKYAKHYKKLDAAERLWWYAMQRRFSGCGELG